MESRGKGHIGPHGQRPRRPGIHHEELEVYFGPWDVEIRHTYRWIEKAGGDTYMGIAEPYAELVESFEIVGAHDFENHTTPPGTIYTLNEYYKKHENEILNLK